VVSGGKKEREPLAPYVEKEYRYEKIPISSDHILYNQN